MTIERRSGTRWKSVLRDGAGEVVVGFLRNQEANTWTASWRLPLRPVPGTYRVHVRGTAYTGTATSPYNVVSAAFAVR